MLFGLVLVAVIALGSVAAFADDSWVVTPHARPGPHFAKVMVVRNDLKGAAGKETPNQAGGVPKGIPSIEASAPGKSMVGNKGLGNAVTVATASPETMLENRLRSLALELR